MTNVKVMQLCAIAVVLAGGALRAGAGTIDGKAALRKALANAKTPADHARLAHYYEEIARSYAQKQGEEEQIAARWRKQYENWTKVPNPYLSAMNLAGYYRQRAKEAVVRAREQSKLATAGMSSVH